jgi:hypothetical protein
MPDVVTLTLDPAGLSEGTHIDTVVITAPGASGSPAKVPVTYTINPCTETPFTPDAEINSTLTNSDCGAPHRSGSFAEVYTFSGSPSDTITLSMGGAFVPYLILTNNAGSVLTESVCPNDVGISCIDEFALPGFDTYRVEATSRDPSTTGGFTLRAVIQNPPGVPTLLRQRESDSTTAIPAGGTTTETTVVLRATVSDPDLADTLTLEVEVKPSGQAFDGTVTATSDPVLTGTDTPVRVSGLADNTGYRWQARTVDKTGRAGSWVAFGNDPDFIVNVASENPELPTGLAQFKSDGTTPIPAAGTTDEDAVVLEATLTDPDPGDSLRLEAEVKLLDDAFDGTGTVSSSRVISGAMASVTVSSLTDDTSYHWRVRTVDEGSNTSAWVEFGATDPDFSVAVPEDPLTPSGESQTKTDATVLAVGDTTDESSVIVSATVSDPDPGDQLRLLVEMRPVGVPFTDVASDTSSAVASGNTATVVISGLTDDTDYHWQIRALDQTGRTSSWKSFGGNTESEADFRVAVPEPPDAPGGNLNQYVLDGSAVIPQGGTTTAFDGVRMKATVTDPDPGDMLQLQVEVQPFGTAFTGNPTTTGLAVPSGSEAQVPVAPLADDSYHWQARVIDADGNTSAWVEFGASGIDFIVDFVP